MVGNVMRSLLAEREFPHNELRFFASARSAGSTIDFAGRSITVEDATTADPTGRTVSLNECQRAKFPTSAWSAPPEWSAMSCARC
ncbi:MAG: hypothetical protein ABR58_02815 [Acidimicrobium sp. BACL19 MAG-120924-bin39]|nr:MAG: hypothetical protein ABR58_02815 [Acidimicrobium sp. BACL19 MAG-120924-bin39]